MFHRRRIRSAGLSDHCLPGSFVWFILSASFATRLHFVCDMISSVAPSRLMFPPTNATCRSHRPLPFRSLACSIQPCAPWPLPCLLPWFAHLNSLSSASHCARRSIVRFCCTYVHNFSPAKPHKNGLILLKHRILFVVYKLALLFLFRSCGKTRLFLFYARNSFFVVACLHMLQQLLLLRRLHSFVVRPQRSMLVLCVRSLVLSLSLVSIACTSILGGSYVRVAQTSLSLCLLSSLIALYHI